MRRMFDSNYVVHPTKWRKHRKRFRPMRFVDPAWRKTNQQNNDMIISTDISTMYYQML